MHIDYKNPVPPEGPVAELKGVCFARRMGYHAGLDHVDFTIRSGELALILVEPGCIQHPMIDLLSGLQECDEGEVRVFGRPPASVHPDEQARIRWRIGRVFSRRAWLNNLDVDENITLAERHHTTRSEAEIEQEMHELARLAGLDRIPEGRPSVVDEMELLRAEWVRAALGSPWLMLLELPVHDAPAEWILHLMPLVERARRAGAAVVWLCSHEDEWNHEKLNPSLKLRAVGNTLANEGDR